MKHVYHGRQMVLVCTESLKSTVIAALLLIITILLVIICVLLNSSSMINQIHKDALSVYQYNHYNTQQHHHKYTINRIHRLHHHVDIETIASKYTVTNEICLILFPSSMMFLVYHKT
eukprot:380749_1